MTLRFFALTVVLTGCLGLTTNAQDTNPLIVSGDLLKEAGNLYDSGQYKKAIEIYQKIDRNDTNYLQALYGISTCYFNDSDFNASIAYARQALSLPKPGVHEPDLLDQIGNDLNEQNKSEQALPVYDFAIRKYPYYSLLYLNKGTALIKLRRFAEAERVFQQGLLLNPFNFSCHYKLGYCAINEGKLIPAMLSFIGYLLLDPQGYYRANCINWLSRIANNTDTIQTFISQRKEDPDENFQLLEQIIQSKIALDKNYKPLLQLDDPISRQIQVLFEKMEYQPADSDFYMQYYIPFFKSAFTNNQFEPLITRLFLSVDLPVIQSYAKKHEKELELLTSQAGDYLSLLRSTQQLNYTRRNPDTLTWSYSSTGFTGHGSYDKKADKLFGPWTMLYGPGNVRGTGSYNANGNREGDFVWYWFNGKVRGKEFYRDGKQEGEETYFFSDADTASHSWYKAGELEGESVSYYWVGTPNTITHYHAGKEDGIKITFDANGDTSLVENYSAGKLNGESRSFSKYKTPEIIAHYKDDELDGEYRKYYPNGQLSISGAYISGKREGAWKWWYANGQVSDIDTFLHDQPYGERIQYHDNGTVRQSYTTREGKLDGDIREFDEDAKLLSIYTYSNGTLRKARYFDKSGNVIGESTADHNAVNLVQYFPNGAKRSETPYDEKGAVTGTQTFYYENGSVLETDVYQGSVEQGPSTSWYLNGKKRSETPYTNGQIDGYYRAWFNDGKLHEEGRYVQGKLQGYYLEYDEFGTLSDSSYNMDGTLEGYRTSFYPNGKRSFETKYHGGWMDSWIDYDSSGKELSHGHLKAGTGMFRLIHANGQTSTEVAYEHSQKSGFQRQYYFDGKPSSVEHFTHGKEDSGYIAWNYDGSVSTRGSYAFDEKTGPWQYYFGNGVLSETEQYVRGSLEGTQTRYFRNGKVKNTSQYKDGKMEGPSREYDPDGSLVYQINFLHDEPISYTYLDARDSLVPAIPLPLHSGKVKAFFPNGKVSATFEYVTGYINGETRIYYPNGELRSLLDHEYGSFEGPYELHYPNGKLWESGTYRHGDLHGLYREYNDKGTVVLEQVYYNGVPEGITRKFDDAGKPLETQLFFYGTLISVKK